MIKVTLRSFRQMLFLPKKRLHPVIYHKEIASLFLSISTLFQ